MRYIPVLTIAGSDSGAGAGIQADLKTFAALDCYGTSVITAITAQNTLGISAIYPLPFKIIQQQMIAVLEDIKPLSIKIGMLYSPRLVIAVADILKHYPEIPIILDPVIVASSGDELIKKNTLAALKKYLFPLVSLVTPNLFEATELTGLKISKLEEMKLAATAILSAYQCQAVLIKGGHLDEPDICNYYEHKNHQHQSFFSKKIISNNTHGTGCTLSSAITAYVAQGYSLTEAIDKAGNYVHQAILNGRHILLGSGNGPLHHFFAMFHKGDLPV